MNQTALFFAIVCMVTSFSSWFIGQTFQMSYIVPATAFFILGISIAIVGYLDGPRKRFDE